MLSFGQYNPLRVIENEAVTLTCAISAYPAVSNNNVRWEKNGVYQGKFSCHALYVRLKTSSESLAPNAQAHQADLGFLCEFPISVAQKRGQYPRTGLGVFCAIRLSEHPKAESPDLYYET